MLIFPELVVDFSRIDVWRFPDTAIQDFPNEYDYPLGRDSRQTRSDHSPNLTANPNIHESLAGRMTTVRLRSLSEGEILGLSPGFIAGAFECRACRLPIWKLILSFARHPLGTCHRRGRWQIRNRPTSHATGPDGVAPYRRKPGEASAAARSSMRPRCSKSESDCASVCIPAPAPSSMAE